jgi:hypothetical protein
MKRKISLMLVFTFFTTSVFGNQFVTKDKCPFLTDNELTDSDFKGCREDGHSTKEFMDDPRIQNPRKRLEDLDIDKKPKNLPGGDVG